MVSYHNSSDCSYIVKATATPSLHAFCILHSFSRKFELENATQ